MLKLRNLGRVFFGIAIAGIGFVSIYYRDFPYMLIPSNHSGIANPGLLASISGALLILAGICAIFEQQILLTSLLLGTVLLLVFSFYFIPYELLDTSGYMHLGEWENAEKELALASGAFVIAGCFSEKNNRLLIRFLRKLIPLGPFLFSLVIISFGIDHLLYAKDASDYIPSWISHPLFWIRFTGLALIGSGISIFLKIKVRLFAALLGTMILIWFVILHIPKVIASPSMYAAGEITSAFLALAYSGISFIIAGRAGKRS